MRLGITLPLTDIHGDASTLRDFAQAAEGLGYHHLGAPDHVLGVNVASRPEWGNRNTSKDFFHDPFVMFGFLSACTRRIEFSTQVMILPQRQTALVAKQAACLDVLSGGRFRFGIGIGWNPVEYVGLNENFKNRGKRSEEQVRLLMLEVNHRAKNMLGVVLAIARQTTSTSPRDFLNKLTQRVQALSVNLDLLVKNEWQGVDLEPLVRAQLAYFSDSIGTRIAIEGPELRLSREAAQGIGMSLHELATNAIKHGALSNEDGQITIAWTCDDDVFSISWQEQGGPVVEPPTRRGFGNTVLTTLAEAAVSGHVSVDYNPPGLRWELTCSARNALELGHGGIRTARVQ